MDNLLSKGYNKEGFKYMKDKEGRWFYTEPLAAAWMAKHFGMKLYALHTDEQMQEYDIEEGNRAFDWFDSCVIDGWERDVEMVSDAVKYIEAASSKIYIHPDSLHLLEPQHGDALEQDGTVFTWGKFCGQNVSTAKVAQRNGIPFMWPEREL